MYCNFIYSSLVTLQQQINAVQTFTAHNTLQLVLNPTKCEVLTVLSSKLVSTAPVGILGNQALFTQHHAKCLGYWWSWNLLSATRAIDKAIKKARKALFATGVTGPFHGKLNPISGKTLSDTCVIPILLYGRENWILPHY